MKLLWSSLSKASNSDPALGPVRVGHSTPLFKANSFAVSSSTISPSQTVGINVGTPSISTIIVRTVASLPLSILLDLPLAIFR